jgi:hypothetical protein
MASAPTVENVSVIPRAFELWNLVSDALGITRFVFHPLSKALRSVNRRQEQNPTRFVPIIPSAYYYDLIVFNLR